MPQHHLSLSRSRLRAHGEMQAIGRHLKGDYEAIEDEPIIIPNVHQYSGGSRQCATCNVPVIDEGPRQSQIDALNKPIVAVAGALTAEEIDALPDGSRILIDFGGFDFWAARNYGDGIWWCGAKNRNFCGSKYLLETGQVFLLARGGV